MKAIIKSNAEHTGHIELCATGVGNGTTRIQLGRPVEIHPGHVELLQAASMTRHLPDGSAITSPMFDVEVLA